MTRNQHCGISVKRRDLGWYKDLAEDMSVLFASKGFFLFLVQGWRDSVGDRQSADGPLGDKRALCTTSIAGVPSQGPDPAG